MKQKSFIIIVFILTLIGIITASISLNQHLDHITNGFQGESFCSINEVIDCEAIDASEYSTFKGVPTAGLGLLFYLIVAIYSMAALKNPEKKSSGLSFSFFLSMGSLVITGFMAYIAAAKLEVFCILCVIMYIVNIFLFLFIPKAVGESFLELPQFLSKYIGSIFGGASFTDFKPRFWSHVLFSFFFILIGSMILFKIEENTNNNAITAKREALIKAQQDQKQQNRPPEPTLEEKITVHFKSPVIDLDISNKPYKGNPNAKVKIVEFSDFECPFCKRAAEYFSSIMKDYQDEVGFYYLNYPLDRACNPKMTRDLHKNACLAAKASLCAQTKSKFWEMHDILFDNSKSISAISLPKFANEIGLNWGELNSCIQSTEIKERLDQDFDLAKKVGVSGTPTVIVNGRKVNGWTNREFLEAILDEEIKRNK